MRKILLALLILVGALIIIYLLGPRPSFNDLEFPSSKDYSMQEAIQLMENRTNETPNLKPNNHAQILWADSAGLKTPYSVVYLHGFSSSHGEGAPFHTDYAQRYGMNLYLSRLAKHGLEDKDAFKDLDPQVLINTAREAIDIGKALGDKVILLMCSTGSTLGIPLAGGDSDIAAMIHSSPNIDIAGNMDELVLGPWGKAILKATMGGEYNIIDYSEEQAQYWYDQYHIDGLISLKYLLNSLMNKETFEKVNQPTFVSYYYKNEEEQDPIVSVDRIRDFYRSISTPEDEKRELVIENGRHVMLSAVVPSTAGPQIKQAVYQFTEEVLGIEPMLSN